MKNLGAWPIDQLSAKFYFCWALEQVVLVVRLHKPPKLLLLMSFLFLSGLIYSSFLLLGNKKGGGRDDYDFDSDSDHGFVVYVCVRVCSVDVFLGRLGKGGEIHRSFGV